MFLKHQNKVKFLYGIKKILLQTLGYIFNLTQYNAIEKLNFIQMF